MGQRWGQPEAVVVLELPPSKSLSHELDGRPDVSEPVDGDDARHHHGRLGLGKHREHQA